MAPGIHITQSRLLVGHFPVVDAYKHARFDFSTAICRVCGFQERALAFHVAYSSKCSKITRIVSDFKLMVDLTENITDYSIYS